MFFDSIMYQVGDIVELVYRHMADDEFMVSMEHTGEWGLVVRHEERNPVVYWFNNKATIANDERYLRPILKISSYDNEKKHRPKIPATW